LVRRIARGLDHRTITREVISEGGLSTRYVIMCALSAAIATLGLMLSSPAVVIGAMLLSPLMGPIILLGFAFWTVDWQATRRAIVGLAVGIGIALLVAILLTALLPLKTPTAEILARTRPNLVDLMIAVFSGVAGAYAVIHRRGETAIGVAIATAVMPPIAAVGFGLGTGEWAISSGALLLFATNLIAIAISAAAMAGLYGFRGERARAAQGWIRHGAVLLVLAGLCVPLTISLRTIALESQATIVARTAVRAAFGPQARLTSLKVRSSPGLVSVDGLVAAPVYVPDAVQRVERQLQSTLKARAHVRLDQVVMADPAAFAAARRDDAAPQSTDLARQLRDATPFPLDAVSIDEEHGAVIAMLAPRSGLDLAGAMTLERGLRARPGLAAAQVVPPVQALDPLPASVTDGKADLGPAFAADRWALRRWRVSAVTAVLCGGARARRTADAIGELLGASLAPASVETSRSGRGCLLRAPAPAYVLLAPAEPAPPAQTAEGGAAAEAPQPAKPAAAAAAG
jgi:uncharacterized hydrophobic protein (TIGR00271 family)